MNYAYFHAVILVSHGSEVTWTWVHITHGFLENFENVLRANWKVLKRKCSKKGISKKGNFFFRKVFKHFKNTIFKNFPFLEIPFLEHFLFRTFQLALKTFFKNFQKSMSYLYPSPSNFRSVGNKYLWVRVSFPQITHVSYLKWLGLVDIQSARSPSCNSMAVLAPCMECWRAQMSFLMSSSPSSLLQGATSSTLGWVISHPFQMPSCPPAWFGHGCRQAHSVGAIRLGAECIQLSKNSIQPLS